MKTMIQTTLLAAALLGLQARAALDAFIHFETVVDTSICIPDGTGTFTQFPVARWRSSAAARAVNAACIFLCRPRSIWTATLHLSLTRARRFPTAVERCSSSSITSRWQCQINAVVWPSDAGQIPRQLSRSD